VLEDHEVIDEEYGLALEQFPDGFQSLSFVLRQRDAVGAGRTRHEVHPVNVLRTVTQLGVIGGFTGGQSGGAMSRQHPFPAAVLFQYNTINCTFQMHNKTNVVDSVSMSSF